MDTFFNALKKTLVASIFVMFALAATYVPQPNTQQVHAGAAAGGSTLFVQMPEWFEGIWTSIQTTASAIYDAIAEWIDNISWEKEWLLDGLAWTVAKSIISLMVDDLINWINSGFEGAPLFVTDPGGLLLDIGDKLAGEFVTEMAGSDFICSPFELDIRVAVAGNYAKVRNPNETTDSCTLTGIMSNLEDFISGTQNSFSSGGWEAWFNITSKPEKYTPYGAAVNANAELSIRIKNKKGEEIAAVANASGFLNQKKCEDVTDDEGNTKEKCDVVTPGKVISDALSKNVDSDRETLVAADEANEIFSAIVGQLGKAVFNEASSLLR